MPENKNITKEPFDRKERNRKRRKKRLDKHTGIDWIDPENGYGAVRGEQALWRAVILQMLEDAASNSQKPADQYNKIMARNWLTSHGKDFYMVCDLAGFDIHYLQKNIKKALLNNCKWRKESAPKIEKKSARPAKDVSRGADSKTNDDNASRVLSFHDFQQKHLRVVEAGHAS